MDTPEHLPAHLSERQGIQADQQPDEDGAEALVEAAPPVVAVMVVRDPGPSFEEALAALGDQDYPNLMVLVVDGGSGAEMGGDDVPTRIASVLPGAYLRTVPRSAGFAAAANEALEAIEGATFLLFCSDRVVAEPGALRYLVEEAYRSNTGILGPKIVDSARPEVLLEVGMTADKFGVRHGLVEPGELDQEQHDAVRDVFFVSADMMLVRADLFSELGGFDQAMDRSGEDLDLCWRARVAGARVMVVPDARVLRHEPTAGSGTAEDRAQVKRRLLEERSRVRTLLKVYSARSLLLVVPQAIAITIAEVVALTLARRRSRSRGLVHGWVANLRRLGALRSERRSAQALRRIPDRDVRYFQSHGSARATMFLSKRIDAEARARSLAETSHHLAETARGERHRLTTAVFGVLALLFLFGSRDVIFGGVPAVGSLADWGSLGDLVREATSGWRYWGLGSPSPAPPILWFFTALSTAGLGAVGLAQTGLVFAAMPIGAAGAYFAARRIVGATGPALVAMVVYATVPVPRNALSEGRLGPLIFYALAPFMLGILLRSLVAGDSVRTDQDATESDVDERSQAWRSRREVLSLGLLMAICGAAFPLTLVLLPVVALVIMVSGLLSGAGGMSESRRGLSLSCKAAAVAFLLLAPWSVTMAWPWSDTAAIGLAYNSPEHIGSVLRLETGPAGAGWIGWALIGAASFALIAGTGDRLRWAVRSWALAVTGWALVVVPGRAGVDMWFAPEALLVLAAFGLSLATSIGAAVFLDEVRDAHLGRRHVASLMAGAAFCMSCLPFVGATIDGRWELPSRDWAGAFSWMDTRDGDFRVLWVGDPELLPLDPSILDGSLGFGLTRNGARDFAALWPSAARSATSPVRDALDVALDGRTDRMGHLLAPMGVRYVAVPLLPSPGTPSPGASPPGRLGEVLAGQIDLAGLATQPGLLLYENLSWAPVKATLPPGSASESRRPSALTAELAARVPDASATPETPAPTASPAPTGQTGPSTLLWAQTYDERWQARADGRVLDHRKAFGWSNAYDQPTGAVSSIRYLGQVFVYPLLAFQVAVWFLVVRAWLRYRPRRREAAPGEDGT